jgi:hypothetical protein
VRLLLQKSLSGITISLLGGSEFGQNEYISLLVRIFSLERPKQNKLVHQWNLGLVLDSLSSPPFEPAEVYAKDSDWAKQPRRRIFWQSWNNDWLSTPIWNLILSKETRIC